MAENASQKFFDTNDDFEKIIKRYIKNPVSISQIQNGWTNFVYKVSNGKNTYFFRFPRNDFFSDALVKEYNFSKFIKDKISFRTTNLKLHYDKGRPYTIHRGIVGESLEDCYNDLNLKEKKKLARDVSKLLYEFSSININDYSQQNFQPVSDFLDKLSYVSQNNYDISKHDGLKHFENENMVLSHGDLNPGNILLRNHKMVAVIDFAFAGVSTIWTDLARFIGRVPKEFSDIMISAFEKKFKSKINFSAIEEMEDTWHYVDHQYMLYIKQNHPSIILPSLV